MANNGLLPAGAPAPVPAGTAALTEDSVKHYIASVPNLAQRVGPADSMNGWKVQEVRGRPAGLRCKRVSESWLGFDSDGSCKVQKQRVLRD